MEVHTPTLGESTVTDPDVEAIPVADYGYLQTSPEYYLKRLLAHGMPSCYQLGPVFRHGERGRRHNPEFVMLEWYRLGFDHWQLMEEVADLVDLLLGDAPCQTIRYQEVVAPRLSEPFDEADRQALDLAFAEGAEALTGRWFVTDYPLDQAVLARPHGETAARFELVIDGLEIANGYWELQDAVEHQHRFEADLAIRAMRELSQPAIDAKFLAAMASGLPDCAGVALGLDRLMMLALKKRGLDGVMAFRE